MNPYFINEPAVITFSGGRSSSYMLYQVLKAHKFCLPEYVQIIFCNTGKEMPQTLDFVRDCQKHWKVDITWLEYSGKKQFKVVDHATASRKGEPFAQLIKDKKFLPNMMARFCTSELKVLTITRYLGTGDYVRLIGIRADEPRRVAKMRAKEDHYMPMADAGVSESDIREFWARTNHLT